MSLNEFLGNVEMNIGLMGADALDALKVLGERDTWFLIARSLKSIFFVLIFLLILAIVVVSWKGRDYLLWEHREKRSGSDIDVYKKGPMRKRWLAIEKQFRGKGKGFKLAVIEADKMVETFLEKSGWKGEGMGGKLEQIKEEDLSTIDDLWEAHRIRNSIVHDFDTKVRKGRAKKAMKVFEDTLKELGVI